MCSILIIMLLINTVNFLHALMAAWAREQVSYCSCSALSYVYSHCPCRQCNGKAVSRATEYRHWNNATLLARPRTDDCNAAETSSLVTALLDTDMGNHVYSDDERVSENAELQSPDLPSALRNSDDSPPSSSSKNVGTNTTATASADSYAAVRPENDLVDGQDLNRDILVAVLKVFKMMDEMNASQINLVDLVTFGRDLYCKGNQELISKWPSSWAGCMQFLKDAGYKEPVSYYVCLNGSHPCLWSTMQNRTDICQYCGQPGTIEFHYLPLMDKVKRWCSCPDFCVKMTAHWKHRSSWLGGHRSSVMKETWDGSRFAELSWFWDPSERWLLPARCSFCGRVISAEVLISSEAMEESTDDTQNVWVECPHCYTQFEHNLKYASGDPRNIALIGHWDGWQPFSTSAKHSCGKPRMSLV